MHELFSKYYKKACESYEGKSLKEIARAFEETYDYLLGVMADDYVKEWLLSQVPITLIKPKRNKPVTAFAADDGRVYVNPAFLKAILLYYDDHLSQSDSVNAREDSVAYVIAHEMLHVILKHPWQLSESVLKETGISRPVLTKIANLAADFVINTNVCNFLFEGGDGLRKEAGFIVDFDNLKKGVETLLAEVGFEKAGRESVIRSLEQYHEKESLQKKTWKEIFDFLVDAIKVEARRRGLDLRGQNLVLEGLEEKKREQKQKRKSGSEEKKERKKRKVKDVTGKEHEFFEEEIIDVRDGYLKDLKKKEEEKEKQKQKRRMQQKEGQQKEGQEKEGQWEQDLRQKEENKEKENREKLRELLEEVEKVATDFVEQYKKQVGLGEGGIYREFSSQFKVDRRSLEDKLKTFMRQLIKEAKVKSAWHRVNRRMPGSIPGSVLDNTAIKKVVAFVDVSGSVSAYELGVAMGVLKSLMKEKLVKEIVVYTFDDGPTGRFDVKRRPSFDSLEVKGGGGTRLIPALEQAFEKGDVKERDLVLIVSDSQLFDDVGELKEEVKKICCRTKNQVLWFHTVESQLGSLEELLRGETKKFILPVQLSAREEWIKLSNISRLKR